MFPRLLYAAAAVAGSSFARAKYDFASGKRWKSAARKPMRIHGSPDFGLASEACLAAARLVCQRRSTNSFQSGKNFSSMASRVGGLAPEAISGKVAGSNVRQ